MKKLALILLVFIMIFTFAACGSNNDVDGGAAVTEPLADIMTALIEGTNSEISIMNSEVTEDRYQWFYGIDYEEGMEGYASEAAISSIAHSVALLRVPADTVDIDALAATIERNAEPRKWICVEAEKTVVKAHANVILVAMTTEADADIIADNFDKYFA